MKNKITDITQENNDKNLNYEKKNNELIEAYNQNQKLKKENEELLYKNNILDKEYNRLLNDIDNKLIQFPIKSFNNINNSFIIDDNLNKENFNNVTTLSTNKMIHKIDSLIYLNKELNKQLSDMNRENKNNKEKINDLENENFFMKDKIKSYEENIQKEINNYKNRKDNEYNETKEVLLNKIITLNNILDQGNKLIKSYELEVADLKNKNSKLEFNLKMLTQSHEELENIVNNNEKGLKEQIDIKDQNYQNLIKEIQLKDLQIKSLEQLLSQYQNEQKENFDKININNNDKEFNDNESIVSFAKDDFREMQLNKMINNFEQINKLNNRIENKEKENNDVNVGVNPNKNIGIDYSQYGGNIQMNNQREAGKIIYKK